MPPSGMRVPHCLRSASRTRKPLLRRRSRGTGSVTETAFSIALKFILRHEGGYVNDPHDPGGETNMGISKRAYPHLPIALLSREEVESIYRQDYWIKAGCDRLPNGLAITVFDTAVNQGINAAVYLLQRVVAVSTDAIIGSKTLAAVAAQDSKDLITRYCGQRLLRYVATPGFEHYGRGWFHRVLECHTLAQGVA